MVSRRRYAVFWASQQYLLLTLAFYQVMALTCDNADNNNTMINEMVTLIPGYRGHDMRVRCFGHVLNLIVKV